MSDNGAHMTGPGWMPMTPPTLERLLAWHPQPLPFFPLACLVALVLYVSGVVRLTRRGDRWSPWRTSAWVGGLVSVLAVTGTGTGGYGMQLFSVHMVQHMVLSMLSPIFLLLGAPITLALRALSPAPRGRTGPRELLVRVVHSRVAQVLCHPAVTLGLFVASLYGVYFTPIFDDLMSSWWGHTAMLVHFLLVGLLFFWPIVGADPAPRRTPHLLRIIELFVAMPFHAFFGIALMMSTGLIVRFFGNPPGSWGVSPMADQNLGGGIAWAFGEVPTVIVLAVVFAQWSRDEGRLQVRMDRAADRDGDAELAAYNDYLARLNRRAAG
jgi:cytochrome c oxidase assembly factor CtaG